MMEMKGLGDLEKYDELSLQKILLYLLKGEEDLELKTEINNPKELACFKVSADYIGGIGLTKSSATISGFIKIYLKYMVSNKRKSREEIIKAVSSLLDKETVRMTISDRLTTNLTK